MPKTNIVRRTIDKAGEKLTEGWDAAKGKFEDASDSTERYIKTNPFKSVLIALGVGALIGAGVTLGIESAVRARMRRQRWWNRYNPFS
jgi:ElaB/YqjD/DUF883 family membrane-anchored ribosome-binding protein